MDLIFKTHAQIGLRAIFCNAFESGVGIVEAKDLTIFAKLCSLDGQASCCWVHFRHEGKACCERPTSRHLAVCLVISSKRDFGKCEMIDSMLA